MAKFKDNEGRDWLLALTVTDAKRVRDSLGIAILNLYGEGTAQQVFGDPITLVDVLYVLCQKQCDDKGITDEQFGVGMVGEAIDRGADALLDAVADFFRPEKRDSLRKIAQASKAVTSMIDKQLTIQTDQLVLTYSDSATNSPAA